jgi:hypothetical protein
VLGLDGLNVGGGGAGGGFMIGCAWAYSIRMQATAHPLTKNRASAMQSNLLVNIASPFENRSPIVAI